MATNAQERFAGENLMRDILDKNPDSVNEEERDILRARKSYLTRDEIEKFNLFPVEEKKAAPAAGNLESEGDDGVKAGKGKAGRGK